jgi:hypothetical protein
MHKFLLVVALWEISGYGISIVDNCYTFLKIQVSFGASLSAQMEQSSLEGVMTT